MIIEYLKALAPEITIIGALTFVQIAPIKINPWSWLAKMIRKALGTDGIKQDIEHLETRINDLEIKFDQRSRISGEVNVLTLRASIISDYTSLSNGWEFGETAYQEFFRKVDLYKKLLKEQKQTNGYIDTIVDTVREKMKERGYQNEQVS